MSIRSLCNRKTEHRAKQSKNKPLLPDSYAANENCTFNILINSQTHQGLLCIKERREEKKQLEHTREVFYILFFLPYFSLLILSA